MTGFDSHYKGIDSRYHRIVQVIDNLRKQMQEGRQPRLRETLALLLLKMVAHFQDEEAQLNVLNLPNRMQHCEHHQMICSIAAGIVHGNSVKCHLNALNHLRSTWLEHMQAFDDCDY
jgi:hypothetical protein